MYPSLHFGLYLKNMASQKMLYNMEYMSYFLDIFCYDRYFSSDVACVNKGIIFVSLSIYICLYDCQTNPGRNWSLNIRGLGSTVEQNPDLENSIFLSL